MSLPPRYQPIPSQAEITGKAQFDFSELAERKANKDDAVIRAESYPDGDYKVFPGDIVLSNREKTSGIRNGYMGNLAEAAYSSLANKYFGGYDNKEAFMRSLEFKGIAKTEFETEGDNMWQDDPLDHGFSFIRAGSITAINGPYDVYSGDKLAWEVPDFGVTKDGIRNYNAASPMTKPKAYLVPFRKTTSRPSLDAIRACMQRNSTQVPNPGIADLNDDALDRNYNLSPLQEEALGFRIFLRNIRGPADRITNDDVIRSFDANMRYLEILCDAITSAMMARCDRIVGVAMGNSRQKQSVDMMLSHFKLT